MISRIKRTFARNLFNILGWRTNRKIVVIESDDWGVIGMPSIAARDRLLAKGVQFTGYGYENYDTLASVEDLSALFDVLRKFRDINNNYPVITANTIVTNPDFEKIKLSDYTEYYYELFTETLKRYYPNDDVFTFWKQGMMEGVFHPQYHGREHLNVHMWLTALKNDYKGVREAFEEKLFSVVVKEDLRKFFSHSYNISYASEVDFIEKSIKDGTGIFKNIFGYVSRSAMAPAYTWDGFVEKVLFEEGVRYIQGSSAQFFSLLGNRKIIRHYTGQKNDLSQIYLVRNAMFEPSQLKTIDNVAYCMKDIENAFFWRKPAIISTHRLNFIGTLDIKNRKNNLALFEELLTKIVKKYPQVEFMTSDELGKVIENKMYQ